MPLLLSIHSTVSDSFQAVFSCSNFLPNGYSKLNMNIIGILANMKIWSTVSCVSKIEKTFFCYYCFFVLPTSVLFTFSFPGLCISMQSSLQRQMEHPQFLLPFYEFSISKHAEVEILDLVSSIHGIFVLIWYLQHLKEKIFYIQDLCTISRRENLVI